MAIPFNSQIKMNVPPSSEDHVITLAYFNNEITNIYNLINKKVKSPVKVLISENIPSVYDDQFLTLISNYTADVPELFDNVSLNIDDRVLIIGQDDKTQNGIYTVTIVGNEIPTEWVFTRADDWNKSDQIVSGISVQIQEGDEYQDTTWILKTDGSITLDTTEIEFIQSSSKEVETEFGKEIKFTTDGIATSYIINHNLNSFALVYNIRETATNKRVFFETTQLDENRLEITPGIVLPEELEFAVAVLYAGNIVGGGGSGSGSVSVPEASPSTPGKIQIATEV
jgi:hypothetical protein